MSAAISLSTRFWAASGMKGQNLLDRRPRAIVQAKRDSRLRLLLAPFQLQAQFHKKQFVEDHTDVRRRARRLQLFQAFAGLGPVNIPQRGPRRDQSQVRPHRGRNRFRQIGRQIVERSVNDAPEPARSKPSDGLIDRNDAPNFQRLGGFFTRAILGVASLAQNFELRLHDLQFAAARILFDLAVERDHLPRHEFVLQVRRVEPQAAQPSAALPHRELKDRHAAGAKQSGVANFGDHRGHLAGPQFGNAAGIQPVFVAKGKIMEQVADRVDAFAGQQFRDPRTNAFHVLHRRGEFKHAQDFSKPMPLL